MTRFEQFKQHFPALADSPIIRWLYFCLKHFKDTIILSYHFLAFSIQVIFSRLRYGPQCVLCCMAEPAMVGGTELQFKLLTIGLLNRCATKVAMTAGYVPGGKNNPYIMQMEKAGLTILSLKSLSQIDYRNHPILCRYLAWLFQILGVKILHLFNPKCMFLAIVAKKAQIKLIYMETGLPCINSHWEPLIPYITGIDQVISVSKAGLKCLRKNFHYLGRGNIISTMIDPPPLICRTAPVDEHAFHLVYFGRLYIDKGLDTLLKAFDLIANSFPHMHMSIIGDGPHRPSLEQAAAEMEHRVRIQFIDPLDRDLLFKKLANSDAFCLPSYSEGTPCSILEAFAIGLPVIATKVGGIPDIIQNNNTGLLVQPKDAQALANAIVQLISNPDQRKKMSEKGYFSYTIGLSLEAALRKYITIYQSLLNT